MCLKQGPGATTPHCVWGQWAGCGLLLGGGGDYQLEGNYVRLAYQLPGKAAEWHTSHNFLDPNNR